MIQTQITPDRLEDLKDRAASFEHVVLVMNTPNKNGRTYPTDVVVDALARMQFPVLGCFMDDLRHGTIPLDKVTHKVSAMWIDGDNVVARIKILEGTPYGKVLKQITDVTGEQDYRTAGQCMVDPSNTVTKFNLVTVGALAQGKGA